jgi:hypothetical protein
MQRRKFVLGLGSLTAAGTAIVGSGAFTTAEATRDVAVEVADDSTGYLALQASGGSNGQFASQAGDGTIELDFSGSGNGGSGVGTNSVYNFDDVFTVTNQGTQTIYVWVNFSGSTFDDSSLYLYPNGSRDTKLNDGNNSVLTLSPGEVADMGVHVDTESITSGGSPTMTIKADVDKPGASESVGSSGDEALVVSQTPDQGDFSSIQAAIDSATGTTVLVEPGTYNEEVTVDKSATIRAAKGRPTVKSPDGKSSTFTVSADNVTIEGFEIKNPTGKDSRFKYHQGLSNNGPISGLTVRNNEFREIGTDASGGNTEAIGLTIKDGDSISDVTVAGNTFENIRSDFNTSVSYSNRFPKAVYVSAYPNSNSATGSASNITIESNVIRDIEGPVSAFGIQLHGPIDGVDIRNNDIRNIKGDPQNKVTPEKDSKDPGYDYASAVQLGKGIPTGPEIKNLTITNTFLSADSSPTTGETNFNKADNRATPGFGLVVEGDTNSSMVTANDNEFAAPGGVINKTGNGPVDATNNYWGASDGPSSDPPNKPQNSSFDSAGGNATADGSGALVVDWDDDAIAEVNFDGFLSTPPQTGP